MDMLSSRGYAALSIPRLLVCGYLKLKILVLLSPKFIHLTIDVDIKLRYKFRYEFI